MLGVQDITFTWVPTNMNYLSVSDTPTSQLKKSGLITKSEFPTCSYDIVVAFFCTHLVITKFPVSNLKAAFFPDTDI